MSEKVVIISKSVDSFSLSTKEIEKSSREHLAKRGFNSCFFELEIIGKSKMQKLNKEFMGKDCPTDVLSFPLEPIPGETNNLIGTIFVCNDIIKKAAKTKGISYKEEFLFIVNHGLDHLVGIHHK